MSEYRLLVLHKLEHSFGYYDVGTGKRVALNSTRPYPHEICLDPGRKKVYIAEMGVRGIESEGAGGHTVAVFDLKSKQRIGTIDTGRYDRPHGIVTFGNRLYVTSESTRHLLVCDLVSGQLVKAVPLEQECAHMVAVDPPGEKVYTTNIGSNSVTAVDTGALQVLGHIPVPERPEGMAFSPDGRRMYVVCREAECVAVIDGRNGEVEGKITTGDGPVRVVITPDGRRLVIPLFHSAAVEIVDTAAGAVTHRLPVGPHPAGTCISPDGRLVFISCEDENRIYVIEMETMEIIQLIETGEGPDAMICLLAPELQGS